MKYIKDNKNVLDKAIKHIISKHRPDLVNLTFLTAWREEEKSDGEGGQVGAEVLKLPVRDRDLHAYDVLLLVHRPYWKSLSKMEKEKLIFHELEHVQVELEDAKESEDELETSDEANEELSDEDKVNTILAELLLTNSYEGEPKRDKDDRVKFYIVPHDIVIRRFKSEMINYGLSKDEEALRRFLNHIKKKVGMTS